jgi:zinc protease
MTDSTAAIGPEIVERTLGNGLKLLVLEKHTTPVVAVQVWYRVGSHDEPTGTKGMAHFLEHMMFRGSEHYGPQEHARLVNEKGGDSNAFTDADFTAYVNRLPAGELDLALTLETDRMAGLKLDPGLFATELNVVKEERRMVRNSPTGQVFLKMQKLLYGDHPYGTDPSGLPEDLESLTPDKCRDFLGRYYRPNNAVLVVVGDAAVEDVRHRVESRFGVLSSGALPQEPDLILPPQAEQRRFHERVDLPVPVTAMAFWIPPARHQDTIPLQVMAGILSGGESARLHRVLVRERELAVAALGMPLSRQGTGTFAFGAAHLPNVSSNTIERALWEQVEQLKRDPVSDEELEKACKQLRAGKVFERYSVEDVAKSIGYAEIVDGDYRMYQRDVEEFARVTRDDVRRVAQEYFKPANATIFHLRPKKTNPLIWVFGTVKSIFQRPKSTDRT